MLVVFDEAANLDTAVLYWLRRLQRIYNDLPFWSLVLSTNSCILTTVPSNRKEPRSPTKECELRHLEPFLGLQLDVELQKRLGDPSQLQDELQKPLVRFASCDHLTMFGRPLWRLLSNCHQLAVGDFVRMKLCSGASIDPRNTDHVFAIIASRLCLDPPINPAAAGLVSNAVHRHLRLVVAIDETQTTLTTMTPSEPIVADAAASILMSLPRPGADHYWTTCITTFRNRLLQGGLVKKRVDGELYARLIFVLARDYLTYASLKADLDYTTSDLAYHSRPFSLLHFLDTLVGSDLSSDSSCLGPGSVAITGGSDAGRGCALAFRKSFGTALLNFTHFTCTEKRLKPKHRTELLHDLMRQCAALRLSPGQPTWDLLIPMYLGNPNEVMDPERLSAIIVSVTSQSVPSSLNAACGDLGFFAGLSQPAVAISLDLGVDQQGRASLEPELIQHQN